MRISGGVMLFLAQIFLASWVSSPSARATTFMPRPLPSHVQDAPLVVRGKVGNHYADWSETSDGGKRIYTYTEIQVAEVFKGKVGGPSVIARELGGEKDGIGMQVSGTAQFERGQDVVVLLGDRNSDGSHDVQGMMMGKFDVVRDAQGREMLAGGALIEGAHFAGMPGQANEKREWSLQDLRDLVAAQGSAPAAPRPSARAPGKTAASLSSSASPLVHAPRPEASGRSAPGLQNVGAGAATAAGGKTVIAILLVAALGLLGWFLFRSSRH
jgi:hypothetical protein